MISGVVLARNEEGNIVECLRSLRPFVDEILLIDMESTDRTVELARPLVSKLLFHPLVSRFDSARNIAIPEASNEWLWFVDADERISEAIGRLARHIVATQGQSVEAVLIPFKSYFCGKWIEHCGWWPGYTMPRLLKKGYFTFNSQLHAGVKVDGRTLQVPPDPSLGIDHFSYRSIHHYLEKVNRYTTTEAEQLAEKSQKWDWELAICEMMRDLWIYYERAQGHLDGEHGWILSWLSGQYRWLSHAKILDHTRFVGTHVRPPSIPDDLDSVLDVMHRELARLRTVSPELPLGIVFRSPIWDPSGYADEGRAVAKALAAGCRPLHLAELQWSQARCEPSLDDVSLFRALLATRRPKFTATITNCIATLVERDSLSSLNILRTANETDRVPMSWVERIREFDEVWVLSQHSVDAFRRSGVPPEKLRIVRSCLDTNVFRPDGDKLQLPPSIRERFVFLSVFDWQLRKGWDALVKAYCKCFDLTEGVCLLLKISRAHGHSLAQVMAQIDSVLAPLGQSLAGRSDVVVWDHSLSQYEMACLYRAADAFVLPSRGEGWGRPYMEAMACGRPTIGTGASGNMEFMTADNSALVPATLVAVTEAAAVEIPTFAGHKWYEPDEGELIRAMKAIKAESSLRQRLGRRASQDIASRFSLKHGREQIELALRQAEMRFVDPSLPQVGKERIHVQLEGEFFAQHSFAIVNEHLARELLKDDTLAFAARQVVHSPVDEDVKARSPLVRGALRRTAETENAIVIRHKFPPNWDPLPESSIWIHIQPWEFGYLPEQWVKPLQERVHEVWAPSVYVRDVYLRSGISPEKVFVIPWGVDPLVFRLDIPALLLPTPKSFRFLFLGGTIHRKGIDVLLEAYAMAFRPDDDVCLVIKDAGAHSFYKNGNYSQQIRAACSDKSSPEILYLDQHMSEGQLASLFRACNCIVAPYRGEGFGLPILEGMACGLPPIAPRGGPSDDFTSERDSLLVPSTVVIGSHPWELCGPPTQLHIHVTDLAMAMRAAYERRDEVQTMGVTASERVRSTFTWQNTVARMRERIASLAYDHRITFACAQRQAPLDVVASEEADTDVVLAAVIALANNEATIADCLANLAPYVDKMIAIAKHSIDASKEIAREYGAVVIDDDGRPFKEQARAHGVRAKWFLEIHPNELLTEGTAISLKALLAKVPAGLNELNCEIRDSSAKQMLREVRITRDNEGEQVKGSQRLATLDSYVSQNVNVAIVRI